jgi:hypothetical protein
MKKRKIIFGGIVLFTGITLLFKTLKNKIKKIKDLLD